MSVEAVINQIKEFAYECIMKQGDECIKASDSMILTYLKSLMYDKDFEIFLRNKGMMLKIFRETAKEALNWLNS